MSFTPGPWKVRATKDRKYDEEGLPFLIFGFPEHSDLPGCAICDVRYQEYLGKDVSKVNAYLIAAAPELYEALKMIATISYGTADKVACLIILNNIRDIAKEALAKAEGKE